jgi:hypothetical protein
MELLISASASRANICVISTLTCMFRWLTGGYKVARQFESHPLHHTVHQFADLPENRSKSARCTRFAIGSGPGEQMTRMVEMFRVRLALPR